MWSCDRMSRTTYRCWLGCLRFFGNSASLPEQARTYLKTFHLVHTPDEFCCPFPARPPPRSTTTTTSSPVCSPYPSPNAPPIHQPRIPRTPPHPHAQSPNAAPKITDPPGRWPMRHYPEPGLARLETQPLLNHARQHRWRAQPTAPCAYSILTSTNKDRQRGVPRRERLPQTAPATHETRPIGPGLTCEFDGGRCWVRTNVG